MIVDDKGIEMTAEYDAGSDRFRERQKKEQDYKKQLPGDDDEALPPPVEPIQSGEKPKRNDACPCGSGKKYKQCCGKSG